MEFEWDEAKKVSNIDKHGVDFNDAMYIWEGPVVEKPDLRDHAGESRFVAFGVVDNRVIAVVFAWRGERRRIISARKANEREQRAYYTALAGVASHS